MTKRGDWALACDMEGCAIEWSKDTTMAVIEMHYDLDHAGVQIRLRTEWRGKGPAPVPGANRAARRRKAKSKSARRRR